MPIWSAILGILVHLRDIGCSGDWRCGRPVSAAGDEQPRLVLGSSDLIMSGDHHHQRWGRLQVEMNERRNTFDKNIKKNSSPRTG